MSTSTTAGRAPRVRRTVGVLAVLAIVACWWTWFRPVGLGGDATMVTVSGSSMEPGMHTGDLAWVRDTDDYAIGDVVAYRVPHEDGSQGPVVIHRITAVDSDGKFVLQGDNNDFRDPWRLRPDEMVGELWLHVPHAGTAIGYLRQPVMAGAAMAAVVVFLVLSSGGGGGGGTGQRTNTATHARHGAHVENAVHTRGRK